MPNDETKRLILARRARFVAAAVAGIAAACGSADDSKPTPCLEPIIRPDASTDGATDAEPQPCLSPLPPDASDDPDADAGVPQPCLKVAPDAGDGGE